MDFNNENSVSELEELKNENLQLKSKIREFELLTIENQKEAELRWQFALENHEIGFWEWNIEENDIYYSRRSKLLLGYEENEFHNTISDWETRIFPEDKERFIVDLNAHFEGKSESFQNLHRLKCKDGSYLWVNVQAKVIEWSKEGKPLKVIGTITDLSSQKKIEEALKLSESHYQFLFENIPIGLALCKMVYENGRPVDFIHITGNEQFTSLFSFTEIKGKRVTELVPGIDKTNPDLISAVAKVAQSGVPDRFELYLPMFDLWIALSLYSPQPDYFVALFQNVSDTKKMMSDLIEEKEKLYVTLQSIGDAVIVTDKHSKITFMNKIAELLTGWKMVEAFEQELTKVFRVINQITRKKCKNPVEWVLKHGKTVELANQTCLISKDGKEIIINECGSPITNSQGDIFGVILVFRDITQKYIEAEKILENEIKFRTIFNHSPVGIMMLGEKGKLININEPYWNIIGGSDKTQKEKDDLIKSFTAFDFPVFQKIGLVEHFKELYDKGLPFSVEKKIISVFGKEVYLNYSAAPFFNKNNEVIGCILTTVDITHKKKMENKILQSETDLKQAQRIAKVGSWKWFFKTNHFEWSDEMYIIYGFDINTELNFDVIYSAIHPEDVEHILQNNIKIFEKSNNSLSYRIVRQDGSIHWVWGETGEIVFDEDGAPEQIQGIIQDVTERVKSDRALRELEERFSKAFNSNPASVFIMNLNSFKIIDVNNSFQNIIGFTKEAVINKSIEQLHLILSNDVKLFILNLISENNGSVANHETKLRKKSGEIIDVAISIEIIELNDEKCMLASFFDITERKSIEYALKESEEKYRKAFLTSPDSININDIGGLFVDINEGFTSITGYEREDVIGKSSQEINLWAIPEDRVRLVNELRENGKVFNLETQFRIKDGTFKTALMSASIVKINGEPHILSITRDISERKKMEAELIIAKEKAEESDKLKSAFLANMSHEIRTPMNAILGFSNLLSDDDLNNEDKKDFISIINKKGNDLLNLINDILDISKIDANQLSLQFTQGDINKLFLEIYSVFSSMDEYSDRKPVELRIGRLLPTNQYIITDFARIKQVLNNLISNAIKFTETGFIEFGAYVNDDEDLEFYVQDTGIGISPENQINIFERFRQADISLTRRYEGTGLGLSICKGIVKLLKGELWVVSALNEGSTFYFKIPYVPYEIENTEEKNIKNMTYNWSGKVILIVEDDLYNSKLILNILKNSKASCLLAENGEEAIEMFKQNPQIDIILMDIQLPDVNGYDVTRAMKKINPTIPVIAQTAFAFAEDKKYSLEIGCDDYIAKPLEKSMLLEIINKHINQKEYNV